MVNKFGFISSKMSGKNKDQSGFDQKSRFLDKGISDPVTLNQI